MNKKRIVGVGEILWDIYRDERFIGGASANVALVAAQLGHEGIVASRIGDDGLGRELIRSLREKGVDPGWLQIDEKKGTGTVVIHLDVRGNPSFMCSHDVAFDYLVYSDALKELSATADAVTFGLLAQRQPVARAAILEFVESAKALKVFDLNVRQLPRGRTDALNRSLRAADILKVNRDEMFLLMQAFKSEAEKIAHFARRLIEDFGLRCVLFTLGAEGAKMITRKDILSARALPAPIVDLTGAGDAFVAGFIHKHLEKASPEKCLQFAVKTSAYVCSKRSAAPEISVAAIEEFAQTMTKNRVKK